MMNSVPNVTALKLRKKSRLLDITFSDGSQHSLSCEFLRVHSPSAEVHGHGEPVLVTRKKQVEIIAIEPVGHYAVKLIFNDGHDTGLYSWQILWELAANQSTLWEQYLARLSAEKGSREPLITVNVKYS